MSSPDRDINTLFKALISFTGDGACRSAMKRVLGMQEQIDDLNATRRQQNRDVQELESKLQVAHKRVEQQKGHLADLSRSLQERESELAELRERAEKEGVDTMQAFQLATAELEAKTIRLAELEGFTSKLGSTLPLNVAATFEKLFRQAFALAQTHFGKEIKDISTNNMWGKFGDHWAVIDKFPLPLDNTPTATHMRVAVFLAILSSTLERYVFLPTYILENVDELSQFLHSLAGRDQKLEAHLRSVLLRAQSETEQNIEARACAKQASDDVIVSIEGLFSEQEQAKLCSDIQMFCSQASDEWQIMQTLDRLVTPISDLYRLPTLQHWKILSGFGESAPQEAGSQEQQSGSEAAARGPKRKGTGADPIASAERVVWPSLGIAGPTNEIVMFGYALSDSQLRTAKAEKAKNIHRDARSRQRGAPSTEHAGSARFGAVFRRGSGRSRRDG